MDGPPLLLQAARHARHALVNWIVIGKGAAAHRVAGGIEGGTARRAHRHRRVRVHKPYSLASQPVDCWCVHRWVARHPIVGGVVVVREEKRTVMFGGMNAGWASTHAAVTRSSMCGWSSPFALLSKWLVPNGRYIFSHFTTARLLSRVGYNKSLTSGKNSLTLQPSKNGPRACMYSSMGIYFQMSELSLDIACVCGSLVA